MAMDYCIFPECPVQTSMGPEDFLNAGKVDGLLINLAQRFEHEDLANVDKRVIELPYAIKTGWFGSKREVTIRQLRKYWKRVEAKAKPHCDDCPANLIEEALGCYGCVNYPISAAGEEWLLDQFNPPDGEAGYVGHHIRSNQVTGDRLDARRDTPPGRGIFAAHSPFTKRLSPDGVVYSSSQLYEYINMCAPLIEVPTLLGLITDFGCVELSDKERAIANSDAMSEILGIPNSNPHWKMDLIHSHPFLHPPSESDEKSIRQIKGFFHTCWAAFGLGVQVLIDP